MFDLVITIRTTSDPTRRLPPQEVFLRQAQRQGIFVKSNDAMQALEAILAEVGFRATEIEHAYIVATRFGLEPAFTGHDGSARPPVALRQAPLPDEDHLPALPPRELLHGARILAGCAAARLACRRCRDIERRSARVS